MSERSLYYWSRMCDAPTARRVERAADTLLNGLHSRIDPLVTIMRSEAQEGLSAPLERADEHLLAIEDALNSMKQMGDELITLNFDQNPQVNAVILHIQSVFLNGLFDASDLLKRECATSAKPEFSPESCLRVVQVLQNTVDYVDIAAGEPEPLRLTER